MYEGRPLVIHSDVGLDAPEQRRERIDVTIERDAECRIARR
jgi:hypothetical protein